MLLALITFGAIWKVVTFLIMLSVLVMLHEYGHFIVARRNGVRVNEYAIGMGPKIVGWRSRRSGTLYSVRALPIGGYCAMEGEDNKSSEGEQRREFLASGEAAVGNDNFQAKAPWRRLCIVLAGPVANFLLAFIILLGTALIFGVPGDTPQPIVGLLSPGMPAEKAGLHVGDRITAVDGAPVVDGNKLIDTLHGSKGKAITLTLMRNGETRQVSLTPVQCPANSHNKPSDGCIGIQPTFMYEHVNPGLALQFAAYDFVGIAQNTIDSVALLVMHFTSYAGQVSGVIGMGQAAGVVQDIGWAPYLRLAATISFALGIFNLLPIPALDGGRAAFILFEMVRGKPVDPEKEAMVHIAGFAALMALMVIIAFHDIARIVSGKGVL